MRDTSEGKQKPCPTTFPLKQPIVHSLVGIEKDITKEIKMGQKAATHVYLLMVLQIVAIILFCLFVRYNPSTTARKMKTNGNVTAEVIMGAKELKNNTYAMFQDVHVMIFLGFGFLMTFLRKYGLSAVSLNLLLSVLAIEVFTLVYGFFHMETENGWPFINLDLSMMLSADFATAAVLISYGVVLGVTSPLQLVIMTVLEIILFVANEIIGRDFIHAVDAGDTIFVHIFGAYFGLAVARVLSKPELSKSDNEGASYNSDLFSMVGTVFLWMFWPSFNGAAAAEGDAQMRAIVNTYYSLCSCVMTTFTFSALLSPNKKFSMEHIQNATLAGGVAVGACADMMLTPGGAVGVGAIAGILSVCGFRYVQPFLLEKLKIHDSCGVNNLHGMPGILGGVLSILMAGLATETSYGELSSLHETFPELKNGTTAAGQALNQFLAILVTLGFASVGGMVTGLIMHQADKLDPLSFDHLFNDDRNINEMEDKENGFPPELASFMEDMKNVRLTASSSGNETKALLERDLVQ